MRYMRLCIIMLIVGTMYAQESMDKNNIKQALIQARAAASRITAMAKTVPVEERSPYQRMSQEMLVAIEALRSVIEDTTDPVALRNVAIRAKIASDSIKGLLHAIRASDYGRMVEKSKAAIRAMNEATELLE
jgi:hypothetical protein